ATVRRWFGAPAGFIAGAAMALTPVAVLMFRFNNPDAMMTLLVVLAAYAVTRALDAASTRWLLLAGFAIGFSFLVKGLQPFTVVPALMLVYLVAAPTRLRTRLLQLLAAGAAIVAGAGWWVLAVSLTPVSSRPYIGGSGNNSALGLAFGYNGLGRITGNESTNGTGGGGGGGGGANFTGRTGLGRLFNSENGGQISWLIPAALIAIAALVVVSRRAPRTDRTRAAAILWGGWLLVTAAVLSYAGGIIHSYYDVELAPAIAALVAIGTVVMWRHRTETAARAVLAAGVVVTGLWSYSLLHRSANWHPVISYVVVVAAIAAAVALLLPAGTSRRVAIAGGLAATVAIAGGSTAYAIDTAATPHTGSVPSAGPAVAGGSGFGGGPGRGTRTGGFPGQPGGANQGRPGRFAGQGSLPGPIGPGAAPGNVEGGLSGTVPGGGGGGTGGGTQTVNTALTQLLKDTTTTWAAATIGSQSAAPLELASGKAIIAIGGFSGSDPAPTLIQFEKLVAEGSVRYFIGGGSGGGPGGQGSSDISSWVAAHFTATTVGNSTVYDLQKATA
ncbi:MAG: hypothetical protein QOG80_1451, partial [Pseudonocardiales bacterium]|nr:hypothetical protein [Pseudonocardiales bacterium]